MQRYSNFITIFVTLQWILSPFCIKKIYDSIEFSFETVYICDSDCAYEIVLQCCSGSSSSSSFGVQYCNTTPFRFLEVFFSINFITFMTITLGWNSLSHFLYELWKIGLANCHPEKVISDRGAAHSKLYKINSAKN